MDKPHAPHPRSAFTLVELLVVITIIGVLIGLLLPAVQSSREAARRIACGNNMRQLALGCLQHLEDQGFFPSGGWGYQWSGDPNQGFGKSQPAGWIYSVLPFIEQGALHDLGLGKTPAETRAAAKQRCEMPLATLYCASRRRAAAYPAPNASAQPINADPVTVLGRSDYAINAGSVYLWWGPGPNSLDAASSFAWPDASNLDGISHLRSEVTAACVRDGLSNTYLIGEKYLNPDHYTTGLDVNDDQSAFSGGNQDLTRIGNASAPPIPDRAGFSVGSCYGSAHPGGWTATFCDGSVRTMTFDIDLEMHRRLSSRCDGMPVGPE